MRPTFSIRLLLSSISQQTKPDDAPQPLRIENNIDLRVKIVFENAIDQRRAESRCSSRLNLRPAYFLPEELNQLIVAVHQLPSYFDMSTVDR